MWALTQAILDIIVHTDLKFDGSYGKHMNVEINEIIKHHNIQNIPWYLVSMTLL